LSELLSLGRLLLFVTLLLPWLPPGVGAQQADPSQTAAALMEEARRTDDAVTFARSIASLVRRAHEVSSEWRAVTELLSEFAGGADPVKRAIAVDAVKSLPAVARSAMVSPLSRMAERTPDGPTTRLYVRGLAETGEAGLQALRRLLQGGRLTGDAASLARFYLRG
jgi:hypothetical protein